MYLVIEKNSLRPNQIIQDNLFVVE